MAPYQTVQHQPGPSWRPGVAFREQPGVERHFATMRGWLEDGVLLVGGPYLDEGGGGMVITRYPTLEAAVTAANADPAVQASLLTALVRPWHPAMWQSALDAAMG
ncbi:MAG TPA: YciI family protein [Actinomycetes bacterium]